MPYDSPGTLVSVAKDLGEIPTGSPPKGASDRAWVGYNLQSAIFYQYLAVLRNGAR